MTVADIPYTKVNDTELKLDLMVPKDAKGPVPAVMVIHGGAWRAGNKQDCRFIMPDFVRHGYAAISPQYRFCPKEMFPAQVRGREGGRPLGQEPTRRSTTSTPSASARSASPPAAIWR